jgi:hypothetical protein
MSRDLMRLRSTICTRASSMIKALMILRLSMWDLRVASSPVAEAMMRAKALGSSGHARCLSPYHIMLILATASSWMILNMYIITLAKKKRLEGSPVEMNNEPNVFEQLV